MPIPVSSPDFKARAVSIEVVGGGASGAVIERLRQPDGRSIIRKSFSAADDWMMRATADPGRAATLWVDGTMDRLPPVIDPAIVAIERVEDGWAIDLEDVDAHFIRRGTTITAAEVRRLLDAAAAMHAAFVGIDIPDLVRLEDLLQLASPVTIRREAGRDSPFLRMVEAGWLAFDELVPDDVRTAVHGVLDDPGPLARELRRGPTTLVHADLHYGNIAPAPDRFYVLDWGLATAAPAAVDVAWYLDQSAAFIEPSRSEVLAAFALAEGPQHDPRALRLALFAELVVGGWGYRAALLGADPVARQQRRSDLDWWVDRARDALDDLG